MGVLVDTRVVALIVGVLGAALGVAAVLSELPALGAAAGLAALVAGGVALVARPPAPEPGNDGEDPIELGARLAAAREDLTGARRRIAELEAELVESRRPEPAADPPGGDDVAALTDPSSQLFSEAYFRVALGSRLAAARRHLRPVAIALLEVTEGLAVDGTGSAAAPTRVAESVRETLRESDIACRLDDGSYAMILEDTPENGAVWTVERVRRNLVSRFGSHTMWAGVACYPAHAFSAEGLLEQARTALQAAREWKQDRIEVAVAE